ncbi:MAG: hypothetical protein US30_C0003G0057 [Candidatus Moranbacteria bacterium GW2011_GWF2_36_839]|nr:MAG: hypothetical protein US27_C0004G0057 [Candidatus Moranbacteria bacterium GW2011_GWF1_36_78]KKQ17490.1 MAG: hypothetical protein US30_C0003G0057 [Candidatus Moranbacteria bacterium GW2011_GWF2_36_839]
MKNKYSSLVIFEDFRIRRHYDEKTETWYFSVIDIVAALIEQTEYNKAKTYWTTLKNRLKNEKSEVVTKCDQLKMLAKDGKMRDRDNEMSQSFPFWEQLNLSAKEKRYQKI